MKNSEPEADQTSPPRRPVPQINEAENAPATVDAIGGNPNACHHIQSLW